MTDKYKPRDIDEILNVNDYFKDQSVYIYGIIKFIVSELMNQAYEEGKREALERVSELAEGEYLTTRLINYLNSELKNDR